MKPLGANIPPTYLVHIPANPAGSMNAEAVTLVHTNGVTSRSGYGVTLLSVADITHQKRAQYQLSILGLIPSEPHFKPPLTKRAT